MKKLFLIFVLLCSSLILAQPSNLQVPKNLTNRISNISTKDTSYINSLMNHSSLKNLNINEAKQNLSPSTIEQLNNLSPSEKQNAFDIYNNNQTEHNTETKSKPEEKSMFTKVNEKFQDNINSKRFGYSIFNQSSQITTSFTPVNDNYILGPGDILNIYIWGKLEQELQVEISSNGTIILPKVGEVSIAGINYGNIRQLLIKKLNKEFVNFDLSVTIEKLRTIRIFILGNVNNPGAYLVNGMTSVFQALFVSNGVSLSGSLRNIKLIRNGKVLSKIDLYHYLLHGNNSHDPILKENDTIFVETVGPLVAISGNVKKPAIYELHPKKATRTSLKKIIDYAGGTTADAYMNRIQIERIEKGQYFKVYDAIYSSKREYNTSISSETISDGDKIKILPILDFVTNFVEIKGNIFRPGKYEYNKHTTLEKLIQSAQGLKPNTYMNRIEIYRIDENKTVPTIYSYSLNDNLENIRLEEFDIIRVFNLDELTEENTIKISGAVQTSGNYSLFNNMTLEDILFKSILNENANKKEIELMRKNKKGKYKLFIFNLLTEKKKVESFKLKKDDHIFIKTAFNLQNIKTISLNGEISFPGKYPFEEGETLYAVLQRANLFTDQAYITGLHFSRAAEVNSNISKILSNEEKKAIFDQELLSSLSSQEKEVALELTQARFKALDYIRRTVVKSSNRVVLKFSDNKSFLKLSKSILLKDGDTITIPQKPTTIEIIGGVQNANKVLYEEGKELNHYVNLLGGFTSYANKKEILVFKVNGSVSKNSKDIDRGDIIYIPEKIHIPFNWITFTNKLFSILDTVAKGIISIEVIKSVSN